MPHPIQGSIDGHFPIFFLTLPFQLESPFAVDKPAGSQAINFTMRAFTRAGSPSTRTLFID
eukprot:1339086-Amphidinium_carterae.3